MCVDINTGEEGGGGMKLWHFGAYCCYYIFWVRGRRVGEIITLVSKISFLIHTLSGF